MRRGLGRLPALWYAILCSLVVHAVLLGVEAGVDPVSPAGFVESSAASLVPVLQVEFSARAGEKSDADPSHISAFPDADTHAEQSQPRHLQVPVRQPKPVSYHVVPSPIEPHLAARGEAAASDRKEKSVNSASAHFSMPTEEPLAGPVLVSSDTQQGDSAATGRAGGPQALVSGSGLPPQAELPSQDQDVIERYRRALALVAEKVRRYPPVAREQGVQGSVQVRLVWERGGRPEVILAVSSGHVILDQQALSMLEQASRRVPLPEVLRQSGGMLLFPVEFNLHAP